MTTDSQPAIFSSAGYEEKDKSNLGKYKYHLVGVVFSIIIVVILAVALSGSPLKEVDFVAFREGRVQGMALMRDARDVAKRMILPPYFPQRNDGRYLGHISSDKPFYKPNDVVFIETWIVDSMNKTPRLIPDEEPPSTTGRRPNVQKIQARATILDAFEKAVFTSATRELKDGTIVFNDWKIPPTQKGGEYQIKVEFLYPLNVPTAYRKIRIGSYE